MDQVSAVDPLPKDLTHRTNTPTPPHASGGPQGAAAGAAVLRAGAPGRHRPRLALLPRQLRLHLPHGRSGPPPTSPSHPPLCCRGRQGALVLLVWYPLSDPRLCPIPDCVQPLLPMGGPHFPVHMALFVWCVSCVFRSPVLPDGGLPAIVTKKPKDPSQKANHALFLWYPGEGTEGKPSLITSQPVNQQQQ